MAGEHLPVQLACRVLHVAESGYYAWRDRPPSNRLVKHALLTEAIVGIHTASRGTYGSRRVHAELGLGLRIHVSHGTVELLMQRAGLPGSRRPRAKHVTPSVADLVERNFTRHARDQLWVTDITEHPRYRLRGLAMRLPAFGSGMTCSPGRDDRKGGVAGAGGIGRPLIRGTSAPWPGGTIFHSDRGVQGAFTQRARASGLLPSMGSIGDCVDNVMMESFWARVQVELFNRRRWRTRLELSTALFEYLEIFHNRQRRHSAAGPPATPTWSCTTVCCGRSKRTACRSPWTR
ncbi:IS3 family transposase [Streptomyces sp. NPDC051572]|uniref:IS3 family transposase n=1 Tax=Streptomyces sp. NPDC051572 TaxID=3155802 RepID=UPI003450FEA5